MTKTQAQKLIRTWTERRDAATSKNGRPQLTLMVTEATWALRSGRYDGVAKILTDQRLAYEMSLY